MQFLNLYKLGNINSDFSKTYTMRPMWLDAAWFLHYTDHLHVPRASYLLPRALFLLPLLIPTYHFPYYNIMIFFKS